MRQPIATSSREYSGDPCERTHMSPLYVETTSERRNPSRIPPQLDEPQRSRTTSRVRFSEESNIRAGGDNWSLGPNVPFSIRNDSMPTANSSCLADKLANMQFSPTNLDYESSCERFRFMDVSRWNLKYDGVSSVNSFLERVEELRVSRGILKSQLLRSAAELFTKDALLWYRTNQFASWDDLIELRDAFQPYDYENGIWDELRRRTQGPQERVVFVAVMEQLFSRLSKKPSEGDRLQLIRRNLLPYIQTQLTLHHITSIRDLTRVCRAIEETEIRVQQFCPPPTNHRNLLEPQLAYRRPSSSNSYPVSAVSSSNAGPSQLSPSGIVETPSTTNQNLSVCWNCRGTGHRFRQCGQPRRLFCYRCGQENVSSNRCPQCSKNVPAGRQ